MGNIWRFNTLKKATQGAVYCTDEAHECKQFYKGTKDYENVGATKHLNFLLVIHIANERFSDDPRHMGWVRKLVLMGMLLGLPDYIVIWRMKGAVLFDIGFLEFKSYKGKKPLKDVTEEERIKKLGVKQKPWRQFFKLYQIKYEIPLSAKEGLDHLVDWGVFNLK